MTDKGLVGGALIPSAAIADDFQRTILTLVRKMCQETKRELQALFEQPAYAMDDTAKKGNAAYQSKVILNKVMKKYDPLFRKWAKKAAKRMVERNIKHSTVQIQTSLKDLGDAMQIKGDFLSPRLQEITSASANEAADLIRLIPDKYLKEVSAATQRSISNGKGMSELIPFLNEKYGQNIRHARNVAHDQTRKTFANINKERLTSAGIKEFVWKHSHGGKNPRELHKKLDGQTFSYDDPPYIGDMYAKKGKVGTKIYGFPGQMINCRCYARPKINFGDQNDKEK